MGKAIDVVDVHKHFGSVHALKGVSLTIQEGEFFGLLGPNGAGKSTLINIIAGLTRASGGSVAVLGHDVVASYREARRKLGIVPQELVFDPFFTVREVLRIQAGYYGLGKESFPWLEELMSALMLQDKADANMRALSGGMKRRVLIAQALVHRPPVVVLDEPTAGVDVELRHSLWKFVQKLHGEGHTVVLTTHYLEEAENLCQRIAILNRGSIVAMDNTNALLEKYGASPHRLRVTLEDSSARIPESIAALVSERQGSQLLIPLTERLNLQQALGNIHTCNLPITDISLERNDLEDIFRNLTR